MLGVLVACIAVSAVAPAAVGGAQICLRATGCVPQFEIDVGGKVSPQALPRAKHAAVRIGINGRIKQGPPLALREALLDVDKNLEVNARGLPACRVNRRDIAGNNILRRVERACGDAIVGRGRAGISVSSPGQIPQSLASRVVLLNKGVRNGLIVLNAHAEIRLPVPRLLSARIEVRRSNRGWTARVTIPVIAGGFGAITHFALNVGREFIHRGKRRSLLSARCPDGKLTVSAKKLVFRNEANLPGAAAQTVLKGNLLVPCKPKG